MSVRDQIVSEMRAIAKEQGRHLALLDDDLSLLDSGFDSLCFAILVVRLEDTLGVDPWATSKWKRRRRLSGSSFISTPMRVAGKPPARRPRLRELMRRALSVRTGAPPVLDDGTDAIALRALAERSWVEARARRVVGRNLLLVTKRALSAAAALCSLDGVVSRLVIVPPDLAMSDLASVIEDAEAHAIIHDAGDGAGIDTQLPVYRVRLDERGLRPELRRIRLHHRMVSLHVRDDGPAEDGGPQPCGSDRRHSARRRRDETPTRWATYYDIRRFGGLQMLLRALVGGHTLDLMSPGEPISHFLARLAERRRQPTSPARRPTGEAL